MLNRQKEFKNLMEDLVGIELGDKLIDGMKKMEEDCQKWQKRKRIDSEKKRLKVEAGNALEPCPYCFSGGEELAKMAVIGINPGKPMKEWMNLDDNTTWKELIEFCVPSQGIKGNTNNVYYMLSKNKVASKFYKDIFLLHYALIGDNAKVYDNFKDLENAYGGSQNIEKEFIERLGDYPVLNSELIPYKSHQTDVDWKKMMIDDNYHNYLNRMLDFVRDSTKKDAYIIFYGKRYEVKELLSVVAGDKFPGNIWKEYMLNNPSKKLEKTKVFFAKWYDERVVILLPSRARKVCYNIIELAEKINKFRLCQI